MKNIPQAQKIPPNVNYWMRSVEADAQVLQIPNWQIESNDRTRFIRILNATLGSMCLINPLCLELNHLQLVTWSTTLNSFLILTAYNYSAVKKATVMRKDEWQ